MKSSLLSPGSGWQKAGRLDIPVWENVNGLRIHSGGLVRVKGIIFRFDDLPYQNVYRRAASMNPKSRRRYIMAWAIKMSGIYKDSV